MNRVCLLMLIILLGSCGRKPKEIMAANEFYVCSMDPQVMEKQPGLCPICKMPLTKAIVDNSQQDVIKLSKEQIKLGNIVTDTVRMDSIADEKTLTGIFAVDQDLQQEISSRLGGRIQKLYFRTPGQEIKEGDLLYEIYSRDLMLAEEEFLSAGNSSLLDAAKNRLLLWGLTETQIKELGKVRVAQIVNPIYSKVSGTIITVSFKEGDYVEEGGTIFKIADLSNLWVEAQVYTSDLEDIELGDKVEISTDAYPGESIDGVIDFINPELQPDSKINLIRVKIDNTQNQFIPGMMADVKLRSKTHSAITLPVDAVLQNGRVSLVWVQNSDGSFEARKVETGIESQFDLEIISGLKEGDVVVISGAYLIYSDYVFKRGAYPLSGELNVDSSGTMSNMKM